MKTILALIIFLLMITAVLSGCTDTKDEDDDDLDDDFEDDLDEDEEDSDDPGGSDWAEEGLSIDNGWYWNPEIVQLNDGTYRMYIEDHGTDGSSLIGVVVLSSTDGFSWISRNCNGCCISSRNY